MKKPKSWPKVVGRGHAAVKIYLTPSNGSPQFTVSYYFSNKRMRKTFADYDLACGEADRVFKLLSAGELKVVELKGEDCLAYNRSIALLAETGLPLESVALQFVEAHRILNGASLIEAARFKAVFKGNINEVTTLEIETFLRELKGKDKEGNYTIVLAPKSRNNYRRAIGTLIYFAESRRYIPKGLVDMDSVAKGKEGEIEIFRPEEMARMLAAAKPKMVPFLAIGAFAGLRSAEIERLDWSEVRLEDGFIEVKAGKAKTASRRLVPITDNLRTWLEPFRKECGHVCEYANVPKQIGWLVNNVNEAWAKEENPGTFKWKHNALRHSFISYRVADIQNVAQVALEAGNSPRMVFSNYRELVRPADAKKWFSIVRKTPENVTPMPFAASAAVPKSACISEVG